MKRILVDVKRCSGCRLCELVCSFKHEKRFEPSASRITVIKEDSLGLDLPIFCWHCRNCKPAENCPTKALRRNEKGLVYVDEEKCSGCGSCVQLCPLGAVNLHPNNDTPLLCDQCMGSPLCVERCPTRALTYVKSRAQEPKWPCRLVERTSKRWRATV